jgi:hypothetical protein
MLKRQEGQAVVEAAIVLPAMIFLILLTIQLTLLQQARIMVEYAAFSAARTGIVANGNNGTGSGGLDGPMHQAAVLSILPTVGNTTSPANIVATQARFTARDHILRPLGLSQVRVYVHNPVAQDFRTYGAHLNAQELDFDDVRPAATDATLLSIQVRYLYEMTVPFANQMLQTIYLATHSGMLLSWSQQSWDLTRIGPSGPSVINDGIPGGIPVTALMGAAAGNHFYFPVEAWYSMRMQSNPYLKWAHP